MLGSLTPYNITMDDTSLQQQEERIANCFIFIIVVDGGCMTLEYSDILASSEDFVNHL